MEIDAHAPPDILAKCPIVKFKKGDFIMPAEAVTEVSIYYILEGNVEVYSYSFNGRRFLVDELGPGEFIGKFSQMWKCNFFSEAVAITRVKAIDITRYKKKLFEDTTFTLFFRTKTLQRLYLMYRMALAKMIFTYEELFAYDLLTQSDAHGCVTASDEYLCLRLNVSRRHYFYLVKKMVEAGALEKKRKAMRILDEAYLRGLARNVFAFTGLEMAPKHSGGNPC